MNVLLNVLLREQCKALPPPPPPIWDPSSFRSSVPSSASRRKKGSGNKDRRIFQTPHNGNIVKQICSSLYFLLFLPQFRWYEYFTERAVCVCSVFSSLSSHFSQKTKRLQVDDIKSNLDFKKRIREKKKMIRVESNWKWTDASSGLHHSVSFGGRRSAPPCPAMQVSLDMHTEPEETGLQH